MIGVLSTSEISQKRYKETECMSNMVAKGETIQSVQTLIVLILFKYKL